MQTSKLGKQKISGSMLLVLAVAIVLFDQITKYLVSNQMELGQNIQIFSGFDLWLVHNSGAAFSFLDNAGGWQRWVLATISLLVSIVLCIWLWRLPKHQKLLAVALSIVLGGAVGNLIDRLLMGYVVDFISVYYHDLRFATFNIADAAISIGAALLVLDIFIGSNAND